MAASLPPTPGTPKKRLSDHWRLVLLWLVLLAVPFSLVGALLMQTLTTTLYALNVSADVATVPKALVILAACLLQSPTLRARLARRRRAAA